MSMEVSIPASYVVEIRDYIKEVDSTLNVFLRPLRPSDPDRSVGIFTKTWEPKGSQVGAADPLLNKYAIEVHLLHKSGNEERGLVQHSRLTKSLRRMLYEDRDLILRLGAITEISDGKTERFQRLKASGQNFMANEVKGHFLFLSVTQLYVETESV